MLDELTDAIRSLEGKNCCRSPLSPSEGVYCNSLGLMTENIPSWAGGRMTHLRYMILDGGTVAVGRCGAGVPYCEDGSSRKAGMRPSNVTVL